METEAEVALRLDGCLVRYEPLAIIAAPLLVLIVARLVHAATSAVAYRGLVAIAAIKSAPPPPRRALLPPSLLLDSSRGHACLLACTT